MCQYGSSSNQRYKCPAEHLGYGPACSNQALLRDPEALLSQLSGRTIGFFGDSMVRQTFTHLVCQLGDAQCEWLEDGIRKAVSCHRHNVTFVQAWFGLSPDEWGDLEWFWNWDGYLNADTIVFGIGAYAKREVDLRNAVERLFANLLSWRTEAAHLARI
mmetsp:Transcript_37576/g.81884  ORF Transcript_37576/g.81884 Transcript_37576/m.81884 type:complete len:159 (-) Transcript_37576:235-711(-)